MTNPELDGETSQDTPLKALLRDLEQSQVARREYVARYTVAMSIGDYVAAAAHAERASLQMARSAGLLRNIVAISR